MRNETNLPPISRFALDFKRDFQKGDTGEDVAKLHNMMMFLADFLGDDAYRPSEEDRKNKRFGDSTLQAAERLRDRFAQNPFMDFFLGIIMRFVFGMDLEEAKPELRRGTSKPIREYRYATDPELQSLEAVSTRTRGLPAAAELAARYLGVSETPGSDNMGPVVRYFNGAEGQPWCGGFVHKIMAKAVSPRLFDQGDFLRARSFEDEAAKHGAFRSKGQGYKPVVGDVIMFTRGGDKGHVGIVSEVASNGTVTYISGNDSNAVKARTIDINNPPASLIGFADTQALARAKGISLDAPSVALQDPSVRVTASRHSDAAVRGG